MKATFTDPKYMKATFTDPKYMKGALTDSDSVKVAFTDLRNRSATAFAHLPTRRYHTEATKTPGEAPVALSYPQRVELSTDWLWVTRPSDTPDTLGAGPSPGKGGGLGT